MNFAKAVFHKSHSHINQVKNKSKAEFAFIGRSNVGKSSLINAITDKNDLAKTSSKPGKTQLINFFEIDKTVYFVDLPGYGYAKVSKKKREEFEGIISEYLLKSENLFTVFVLIDSAIPPQRIDLEFLNWCGKNEVPVCIVFTKGDKKKAKETRKNISDFETELLHYWEELPLLFETSSIKKAGIDDLKDWISESIA